VVVEEAAPVGLVEVAHGEVDAACEDVAAAAVLVGLEEQDPEHLAVQT